MELQKAQQDLPEGELQAKDLPEVDVSAEKDHVLAEEEQSLVPKADMSERHQGAEEAQCTESEDTLVLEVY